MTLSAPFRRDASVAERLRLRDLMIPALIAFVAFPAAFAAIGFAATRLATTPPNLFSFAAAIAMVIGYTGIFAAMCSPAAIAIGWITVRTGRIGWAHAVLAGAGLGGLVAVLLTIGNAASVHAISMTAGSIGLFAIFGAIYAALFWLTARYLRADALNDMASA